VRDSLIVVRLACYIPASYAVLYPMNDKLSLSFHDPLVFLSFTEKMSFRQFVCLWLFISVYTTEAFSHPLYASHRSISDSSATSRAFLMTNIMHLRSGQQEPGRTSADDALVSAQQLPKHQASLMALSITPQLQTLGKVYAQLLQQYPIRTKSITAGFIFALSAIVAQLLEKRVNSDTSKQTGIIWSRVLSSSLVGLVYYGPAAHYWYKWVFHILPAATVTSAVQKAILGQLIFGPAFTCTFFAVSLVENGTFTVRNWLQKIRTDLPSAWLAGAGFWPIVDLVSYVFISPQWIPLFISICSFFWTTFLVLKSYS
jgi:protein Mpv17